MTQLRTIRARTSERAIDKVSRLFNASLKSILQELLQNSRRSGATHVSLSTAVDNNRTWLCIADDGAGIDNPEVLLTLGESEWESSTVSSEDPAGMGFFSLAGRGGQISSRDWSVELLPEHFNGQVSASVVSSPSRRGTAITVPVEAREETHLEKLVTKVVEYYPLPVEFNGTELPRENFLGCAVYVESWRGLNLGVFSSSTRHDSRINFYGITLTEELPVVAQVSFGSPAWTICINVVNCPQLKLVLPARQEVVQNAFLEEVRQEGLAVIYRYIATQEGHRLPYHRWREAQELGIDLPEPLAQLYPYQPSLCDSYRDSFSLELAEVPESALLISFEAFEVYREQVFWRAYSQSMTYLALKPQSEFAGYSWYENIPVLSDYRVVFTVDGEELTQEEFERRYNDELFIEVGRIVLYAKVEKLDGVVEFVLPTDIYFLGEQWSWLSVEDIPIVLTHGATISPEDLAELLEECFFLPNDDYDADSYETQLAQFQEEATKRALSLLVSEKEAVKTQINTILEREMVRWHVPENWRVEVAISRDGYSVEVTEG